jgi:hypothetical protein
MTQTGRLVAVISGDQALAAAAAHVVAAAGAKPWCCASPAQAGTVPEPPVLVVCGGDVPAMDRTDIAATFHVPVEVAALGEFGSGGDPVFLLPRLEAGLLRRVEQSVAPRLPGHRVALIGAQGGLGTSTLAAALARRSADTGVKTRLAAMNPAGAPLEVLLALADLRQAGRLGGTSWATVFDDNPDWAALPQWNGVSVLAGLANHPWRHPTHRFRAVLDSWEAIAPGGTTVLDGSLAAPGGAWRLASWCDRSVVLARDDPPGLAAAAALIQTLAPLEIDITVVLQRVKGGAGPNGLGLPAAQVITTRPDPVAPADAAHGVQPGDRPRSVAGRLALQVAQVVLPAAGAGHRRNGVSSRRFGRASREHLPQFDLEFPASTW